ncbi:MAG: MFS transporter [Rhodoferax sp.]|nr:MFS transporter [Rhodoferax sp.]
MPLTTKTLPATPPLLQQAEVNPWLVLLLAFSCGLVVANIYYAQPLAGPIRLALGMSAPSAGLVVTLTQVGYGLGLLFVVPLADYVENRRLVLVAVGTSALSMLAAASSTAAPVFLVCALLTGISSVAVQVLVLYAAHMAHDGIRGRVVGSVMSGLMLGIMLARPVASLVADLASWQAVYQCAALAMLLLLGVLGQALPQRQPHSAIGYRALMGSMVDMALHTVVLRRRGLYQACMFGSFSLFWTVVPLHLAQHFGMAQRGIALFALAGVAGAIAAPIAGRVADRGWVRQATAAAMLVAAAALLLAQVVLAQAEQQILLLALVAILLDFGVSANLVLGQRVIFSAGAAQRGRFNAIYMATFFAGGAIGSALGGWAYAHGGWSQAAWVALGFVLLGLAYFGTEQRKS